MEQRKSEGQTGVDGRATFPHLEEIVASAFGVTRSALQAPGRGKATIACARQVGMYLAHTRLRQPYVAAGALFNRDRTTAAHACRRVEDKREDRRFDALIDCLERAIDCRAAEPAA
jgi:chromosomal replication initiation ATPase DnaA